MKTSRLESFAPKSVLALRDYSVRKFIADLIAGLTVGHLGIRSLEAHMRACGGQHGVIVPTI
jgi:hypothetical protein